MNKEVIELNYTEKYEYAKKTIQNYLELERDVDLNTEVPVDIYSEDTFVFGIMVTDFRVLTEKSERDKISQRLDRQTKKDAAEHGERSYTPLESRLYHAVIDVFQTLGESFIAEVRRNLIASILHTSYEETHRKVLWFSAPTELTEMWDTLEEFLTRYPLLIIASIGYTEYIRAVMKMRKAKERANHAVKLPAAASKPIIA